MGRAGLRYANPACRGLVRSNTSNGSGFAGLTSDNGLSYCAIRRTGDKFASAWQHGLNGVITDRSWRYFQSREAAGTGERDCIAADIVGQFCWHPWFQYCASISGFSGHEMGWQRIRLRDDGRDVFVLPVDRRTDSGTLV